MGAEIWYRQSSRTIEDRIEMHSESSSGALTYVLREGEADLDRERLPCMLRLLKNEVLSSELLLELDFVGASKKPPL